MAQTVLMSIAYMPSIAWVQQVCAAEKVILEKAENYQKQSYRTRCKILSANGVLDLSIPVAHANSKQLISEVITQETENWRKQHWQAICSAYGKSAFFLFYRDALEKFFLKSEPESLFEHNLALINLLLKQLKLKQEFEYSAGYEPNPTGLVDLRNSFHAKGNPVETELLFKETYFQVFAEKFPFQANLSVLDLLFNVGPMAANYLRLKD